MNYFLLNVLKMEKYKKIKNYPLIVIIKNELKIMNNY